MSREEGPIQTSAATPIAERALVEAAIAGDETAFAALYDLHLARVYRHVYYRVGNRADAEDLTQQTFLQAWRAIRRYRRTTAPFVAWLLTIAHNLIVSFYRRSKNERYLRSDALDPPAQGRWSDPESSALAAQDREAVRRAIGLLKPEQQQVVGMRFLEDFDYTTIAAVLGKSEGNVRVIQHRALVQLRRLLAEETGA